LLAGRREARIRPHTAGMDSSRARPASVVVTTTDPELLDRVLSVTAAADVEPIVVADPGELRPLWTAASIVLVGMDQAAGVATQQLPRRAEVYVLGGDRAPGEAYRWSTPLGAAVLLLPSGATWLAGAIADLSGQRPGAGLVICVVGGSGGAGASTCAAALAFVAAQTQRRTLLVDADPSGGGLDLLLGAERVVGWRWPRLAGARGHLGDLGGRLPRVDEVDVLSTARGESPGEHGLSPVSVKAVMLSAMRSHDLTVVDLPRCLGPASREAVLRADLVLLIVRDDIRGVAAAREVAAEAARDGSRFGVVVRQGRSRNLAAGLVAGRLGIDLIGTLGDDPGLAAAAERGDPPGRASRSPIAQCARRVLDEVWRVGTPTESHWTTA
jgi:secretion/DNA translocation related CpaE-like protein